MLKTVAVGAAVVVAFPLVIMMLVAALIRNFDDLTGWLRGTGYRPAAQPHGQLDLGQFADTVYAALKPRSA